VQKKEPLGGSNDTLSTAFVQGKERIYTSKEGVRRGERAGEGHCFMKRVGS